MTQYTHTPVLLEEVIRYLQPEPIQLWIDGTVGQGGHASAIAERILPGGRLIAIDRDPVNLEIAKDRMAHFGTSITYVNDSYANIMDYVDESMVGHVNGILLDLGYSSLHVDDASRGFSFQHEGPLDMRYSPETDLTAADLVRVWSEEQLARLFRIYGEEVHAARIARAIVETRAKSPILTTTDLAQCVAAVVRGKPGIHPATKVFQALRIAVNNELGELESVLPRLVELLAPGGKLGIISFHSLEDRIVKQFFAKHPQLQVMTKKPIAPTRDEEMANPRARSAKFRVAFKK